LIFLEISLFIYSYFYLGKAKVYEFNDQTGYNFKKMLLSEKVISDEKISFITDNFRLRVPSIKEQTRNSVFPDDNQTRVLVAGDSFAEGQTNVEYRFDYVMNNLSDNFYATAVGCGGFDTLQQIKVSEPLFKNLRKDDYFILLTCGNDFGDILRKSSFGRSKPYLELNNGSLKITEANNNLLYRLRDISYTIGYALQFWDALHMKFVFNEQETRSSQNLYISYITHVFNELSSKGIRSKIVFHSLNNTSLTNELFSKLHFQKIDFFNLDNFLRNDQKYLLDDKFHWNVEGNKLVAEKILFFLEND
jgi:hypothetical protein